MNPELGFSVLLVINLQAMQQKKLPSRAMQCIGVWGKDSYIWSSKQRCDYELN